MPAERRSAALCGARTVSVRPVPARCRSGRGPFLFRLVPARCCSGCGLFLFRLVLARCCSGCGLFLFRPSPLRLPFPPLPSSDRSAFPPPRSDEKGLPDRISSFGNRVCRTKRRCERKEAVRTRQTTSPAGSEAGAGISCGISYGISCAMRVPVRRPCPHPVPACIPRPHPAASSRMRAVQAL